MSAIGVIQGRLSPPVGGRLQGFPATSWRQEFPKAREAGLACIEWIYECGSDGQNPLGTDNGIEEIRRHSTAAGVAVSSVCADYYMEQRLVTPGGEVNEPAARHLAWLTGRAAAVGARYVVLPFVDASSLGGRAGVNALESILRNLLPLAERAGVELHLETDLAPVELAAIFQALPHPLLRSNYDLGNSASLGHDPEEELTLLGPMLGSVHVKDRLLHGGTVPLGTGAVRFEVCFRLLRQAQFRGPYILQVAREVEGAEVALAVRNRRFVEGLLAGPVPAGR